MKAEEKIRVLDDLHTQAVRIWDYPLLTTENVHLTVGKVVLGIIGLLIAFAIAKRLATFTVRAARQRFQLGEGHAVFMEKLTYYLLAVVFTLTVLNWLSIPLTVFAFLGGALAIGIGFGTQTLMNSFISGIIMLFERTIRVGDIIEVNGSTGTVTHLGTRCSRIRKSDGVELLIPNSTFLSTTIVNWTLSDPNHCYEIAVGIAYGSPTDKVITLLQQAMDEQPEIIRHPAPCVYFDNFGDSALAFTLVYWLATNGPNTRRVASNIRLRIDQLCSAAGIEIPFPQRDLRLHTDEPLAVKVIAPDAK